MYHPLLTQTALDYLNTLCIKISPRPVGSTGNRLATDWFAQMIAGFGFAIEMPPFDCMDWLSEGVSLRAGDDNFSAQASPYSLGCDVRAPLVVASTIAELEEAQSSGKIVLLHGEIAREQLMPKNFPFYNPDEHQHIYRVIESQQPAALIAATGGVLQPFPLFEDGDFDIPSVYLSAVEGARIARHVGQMVHLHSHAERHAATGCNVIARKPGKCDRRIVVMAHIDAKAGTPGALDNGAGIVTLLLLAEMLSTYNGHHCIEIVAINGEDYYANSGEIEYLRRNHGAFDSITLGINLDGLGYIEGRTVYSLYACPPDLSAVVHTGLASFPDLYEGDYWYQGDHMILVMQQRPALAFTSERAIALLSSVIHTGYDLPSLVDPARLVEAAHAVREVIGWVDCLGVSGMTNGRGDAATHTRNSIAHHLH